MIAEIKSTPAKSGWLPKGKKNAAKKVMIQAEEDVIDVLSLIPPEILMVDNEDIYEGNEDRLPRDVDEEFKFTDVPMNGDGHVYSTSQGDCNILQEIVNRLTGCASSKKWKLQNHFTRSTWQMQKQ